jgi:hypothetical protein
MSFADLPDAGREVQLTVCHETFDEDYGEVYKYKWGLSRGFNRSTAIMLTDRNHADLSEGYLKVRSVCKENKGDNFSKREGRRRAANTLLKRLRSLYSKADRRAIFQAVCPEYQPKN